MADKPVRTRTRVILARQHRVVVHTFGFGEEETLVRVRGVPTSRQDLGRANVFDVDLFGSERTRAALFRTVQSVWCACVFLDTTGLAGHCVLRLCQRVHFVQGTFREKRTREYDPWRVDCFKNIV